MKTLIYLLMIVGLSSMLMAQIDSTSVGSPAEPDTTAAVEEMPVEEVETTDSTDVDTETMFVADSLEMDTTAIEVVSMDSTLQDSSDLIIADTSMVPEPLMEWVQNDPAPTSLAGLVNEGNLYFWTNDAFESLDFTVLPYISIVDPTMIAINANDCLDIVCHLLASDGSGVDYVVVTKDDSSNVQIYNTTTKVVAIEAPADSIVMALDTYLKGLAGMELLAVVAEDTTEEAPAMLVDADAVAREKMRLRTRTIRNNQFRELDDFSTNPANLARNFNSSVTLNLLPDFSFTVHNSLLTPGWYTKWWTTGEVWDAAMKADYLSTIMDKQLALNIAPEFKSILGFRIGSFGLNISGKSHIKVVLPGNTLGLPMQDILFDEPIDNGGLEIEAIPFVSKTALSYARAVQTPYGEIKVGAGLNLYEAVGYTKVESQDFTITVGQDSTVVTASGEGWVTRAGFEGSLENSNTENLEPVDALSSIGVGFDVGAIMDLYSYLDQEVEVQVALRNLGATYKWSDVTHSAWTMDMVLPALSSDELDEFDIEEYQTTTDTTLATDAEITIDVPTVFSVNAIYQPVPQVMVGLGIEKAFTDEVSMGYGPDLAINYQLNLYAFPWLDFSYYKQNKFGEPVHTFGGGFHFGFLETGLTMSFLNGLNTNAKGMGFGLSSSLHF